MLPASPLAMVAIMIVCFAALGAGNGAVFQLVPLRFKSSTVVASSLVGELGGLAGALLPTIMGYSKEMTGSFAPGFLAGSGLAAAAFFALLLVMRQWTTTWVGNGGKALVEPDGQLSPTFALGRSAHDGQSLSAREVG